MNKILYNALLLFSVMAAFAQQEPQYSQYQYNTMTINPGYTGSRGHLAAISLYRNQWAGIEGAPRTITFGLDTPVGYSSGLGLSIIQDDLGPASETFIDGNYSHILYLSNTDRLALGIKAGVRFFSLDWSRGIHRDPEAVFNENISGQLTPTVGTGVFYYSPKAYIGLSTPNVLQTTFYDEFQEIQTNERTHLYFIGGYVFDINPFLKFKPSTFIKQTFGAPISIDLSTNFLMNDKLTLGLNYRWDESLGGLLGFEVNSQFNIGYAYDFSINNLGNYNSGTHEVFIRYRYRSNPKILKSPRFF
ncbi:MAG: type IX secretion system membrane protein PorP/SprF [Bacteroidota bacterium]